jgi:excisionase family DNA binding protein
MDVALYTVDEAAAWLRVSRWTVYNLIRSGQLQTIKIGRRRLVPTTALTECLNHLKEMAA